MEAGNHEEFQALIKNHTWDLADRPENRSVIEFRLVLRNKCNAEGIVERRKARVVTKGYSQRRVDFKETFATFVLANVFTLVKTSGRTETPQVLRSVRNQSFVNKGSFYEKRNFCFYRKVDSVE